MQNVLPSTRRMFQQQLNNESNHVVQNKTRIERTQKKKMIGLLLWLNAMK